MDKYSRWAIAWVAFLVLVQLPPRCIPDENGVLHTLDLPSSWNDQVYTDLCGWISYGSNLRSISPDDSHGILKALRPGDHVEIRCLQLWSLSGDRAVLLVYTLRGPAGYRWAFATSNTLLFAALVAAALLPLALWGLRVMENRTRRHGAQ